MKKMLVLLLLNGVVLAGLAQEKRMPLSDQLKETDCQFVLKYKGNDLKVLDQKITKRAVREKMVRRARVNNNQTDNQDTVYNETVVYNAYFIEFSYKWKGNLDFYALQAELVNHKGEVLHVIRISKSNLRMTQYKPDSKLEGQYLAISLEGMPLILLDDVVAIHLKK